MADLPGASATELDVAAPDLLVMLAGVALATGRADQHEQAGRLLDLALEGMSVGRRHDVA